MARFWTLAKERLTDRQYIVLRLTGDGLTQVDIAKQLNISQGGVSAVFKKITEHKGKISCSGVNLRLRKVLQQDAEFMDLINLVQELTNDKL